MESLPSLRRERRVFATAVNLTVELSRGTDADVLAIAEAFGEFERAPGEPGAEWETKGTGFVSFSRGYKCYIQSIAQSAGWTLGTPTDSFLRRMPGAVVRECGRRALCEIFNFFNPVLVPSGERIVELPPHKREGILPVLYFMLRQDCLRRQGIKICALTDCGAFFAVERYGQRFCEERCS